MNTKLGKNAKNDFKKDIFKSMNNVVFGKTMYNARKHRAIKLVRTEARRNHFVSEPNYHTNFISHRNEKNANMKKPVRSGLYILEISKIVMYGFWYDYLKSKYEKKNKKKTLHGYKQIYSLHKIRRHLRRHCKRC